MKWSTVNSTGYGKLRAKIPKRNLNTTSKKELKDNSSI